jgi:tRNA-2-methylthio-N6-dimethylallyladenosine synthase
VATRTFEDTLSHEEKERRRKTLDDLQAAILTERNARYLGQTVEVLVEGRHERRDRWYGRTCRDRLVFFPADDDWLGRMARVEITWAGPWSLVGEVVGAAG